MYVTSCICVCLCRQAAAAFLFSQMLQCGLTVEVTPEDMLGAALAEFTDLSQASVIVVWISQWLMVMKLV